MKKTILCFLLLVCLVFVGCGETGFDREKSMDKLKNKGFEVSQSYTTREELRSATHFLNASVEIEGGTFTVECTYYTTVQKGDHKNACTFIEFATEEQAKSYYDLYIQTRTEESLWKLALHGRVVLLSNSDEAMKIIGGEFK